MLMMTKFLYLTCNQFMCEFCSTFDALLFVQLASACFMVMQIDAYIGFGMKQVDVWGVVPECKQYWLK